VSTIADIKIAKARWEDHQARHHCITGDGCPERVRLWLAYQAAGAAWGLEASAEKSA
jgi:hypothetical protein